MTELFVGVFFELFDFLFCFGSPIKKIRQRADGGDERVR